MKLALSLYGIPKILLRNSVPTEKAEEYFDDYEITPEYSYEFDEKSGKVKIIEKPWIVLDDERRKAFSLLPPPVVVSLIKQMAEIFGLRKLKMSRSYCNKIAVAILLQLRYNSKIY